MRLEQCLAYVKYKIMNNNYYCIINYGNQPLLHDFALFTSNRFLFGSAICCSIAKQQTSYCSLMSSISSYLFFLIGHLHMFVFLQSVSKIKRKKHIHIPSSYHPISSLSVLHNQTNLKMAEECLSATFQDTSKPQENDYTPRRGTGTKPGAHGCTLS